MAEARDRTSHPPNVSSSSAASRRQEGAEEIRSAQRRFLWGWSRLALGVAQMGLAAWAVVVLIGEGFSVRLWILIAAATLATATSRVLFRGRKSPTR